MDATPGAFERPEPCWHCLGTAPRRGCRSCAGRGRLIRERRPIHPQLIMVGLLPRRSRRRWGLARMVVGMAGLLVDGRP